MSLALQAHSTRFGISARGPRAWFWYDESGTVRRRSLEARWEKALEEIRAGLRPMTPAVFEPGTVEGTPAASGVQVSVNVLPGGAPDLYRVTVVSRSSASVG